MAIEFTVFEVNENVGLVCFDVTIISGSFLNASQIYFCASRIPFAFSAYPFFPCFSMEAQVPAMTDPGLLPAMHVVA